MPRNLKKIKRLPRKKIEGVFFRIVAKRHFRKPLDTKGSLKEGGRYNPPEQFGVIYLGETAELCWLELERRWPRLNPAQYVVFEVKVKLSSVLDLTSEEIRKKLFVRRIDDLLSDNYDLTRNIGVIARKFGFEAILTPSATQAGKVLVVFLDMLHEDSRITLGSSPLD